MEKKLGTQFFLGSNSAKGFYSLYDDFVDLENGDFLWAIKGGPGCGKSSFMRKIGEAAERAGLEVEYILCSGDPKSLDGIYIPARRTAYVDATAPHVIEATYPAAASLYLDLGIFYDNFALRRKLPELVQITKHYKGIYKRAYDIIKAAQAVSPMHYPGVIGREEIETVMRRVSGVITREFGRNDRHSTEDAGKIQRRFISAFTCEGQILLEDTIEKMCDRVYTLDNEFGLAHLYLNQIARVVKERKLSAIFCFDPICPELLEAVLIPELSLGFLALQGKKEYRKEAFRHVRLDAVIDADRLRQMRPQLRQTTRRYQEMMQEAEALLCEAKKEHDHLENVYNAHVDFEGVYELCATHIAGLSLE